MYENFKRHIIQRYEASQLCPQMKNAFKASVLYKHINSNTQKRETDIGNGV